MSTKSFTCAYCGKEQQKRSGEVNRALRSNRSLFCDRMCSGMWHRTNKTESEKKEAKRIYDIGYRERNKDALKKSKAAYFKRAYDPVKAAAERKLHMDRHVKYCRTPTYKAYKSEYDKRRRSSRFGDFAEAYMLLLDIDREIKKRATDYEIRIQNGTINKQQQRRREYERITGNK